MSDALPAFAELHAKSNFSFLDGVSHPEELVLRAAQLGYSAIAITDECSLAGVVRAHQAAIEIGLPLIVGTELWLVDGPGLVILATDRPSYARLSRAITEARMIAPKGTYYLERAALEGMLDGCLLIMLPKLSIESVVDPNLDSHSNSTSDSTPDSAIRLAHWVETLTSDLAWLERHFSGRCWLGAHRLLRGGETQRLILLERAAEQVGVPVVALGGAVMHARSRRALRDLVTAIKQGCTVAEAGAHLASNGEAHLRDRRRLATLYPEAWLAETLIIARRCQFSLSELRYEYPQELTPPGRTLSEHLRVLTELGVSRRWPGGAPDRVLELIEHELALIADLHYEAYFLTVHDLVVFARSKGILCQGRGSAANSAVCYCLGITEVDPARMQMLFERFISKERDEPPDIDVDFEHERREEVIQYIYQKYGRQRAAIAATVITYRPRSAIRDVGKALGFDLDQVDRLAKSLAWWDGKQVIAERFEALGFDPKALKMKHLASLVDQLIGFPRHLSQHTGGFVIARDAVSELVPIENAAMPDRTVIQWDKNDLEALGLLKVDVLALGILSAIHKCFDLIRVHRGRALTMSEVPAEDPAVYEMIQRADTVGVFQIESRAQMAMLPRMRPTCFYDLVVEVAIVRPGPIQGGMVHPYLRRRQGTEAVTYPSEAVRHVLSRTLGVPIFQEQVMQLAVVAAGFTPGEADQLRRAMAAWRRKGGLAPFEERLIDGMRDRGYGEEFARQIFRQIEGFGDYGFPESHSASFALLVYVSAWLKCHEPAAFCAAMLNSQPLGFYAPAQLVRDAREHGVEVRPVDVQVSHWDCTLEAGGDSCPSMSNGQRSLALRLGFRQIKGLSRQVAERVIAARSSPRDGKFLVAEPVSVNGSYLQDLRSEDPVEEEQGCRAFQDVQDLASRAGLSREALDRFASAGALASLTGNRHRARWSVWGVEPATPLLGDMRIEEGEPLLRAPSEGEDLVADHASLGLSLGRHPMTLLRSRLGQETKAFRLRSAAELYSLPHGSSAQAAGIVVNRQRPSTASGVIFMTLEDETGFINLVLWPWLVERQRQVALSARLLVAKGVVEREGEVLHLIAGRLEDHSKLLGALDTPSRDFH